MTRFEACSSKVRTILEREDIRAAIIYLNGLTGHRFTAIYRFDNETLQSLYFFDRENPAAESTPDVPVMASYCVFVRDSAAPFVVEDSTVDQRLRGHPKRSRVQSYCGVPLVSEAGVVFGTACHFDVRPMQTSATNLHLLEALGPLLKPSRLSKVVEVIP